MIYQPIEPWMSELAQVDAVSAMRHLDGELSDDDFIELLAAAVDAKPMTVIKVAKVTEDRHGTIMMRWENGRMVKDEQ